MVSGAETVPVGSIFTFYKIVLQIIARDMQDLVPCRSASLARLSIDATSMTGKGAQRWIV